MNKIKVTSDRMYEYSSITPVPKGQIQFSKILFYLSEDWRERNIIVQFKQGEKVLNISLNSDNTCYIPSGFDIGLVTVYLKGYDLDGSSIATANGVSIPIVQGAFDGGDPAVPPEPDLYAKLIEEFSKGIDQERISIAVEEYLNENPIQEKDPTVPEWAKAAEKPSYTAAEVGADPSGTAASNVAAHNTGTDTHSDIRLLISGLTDRINALADSDDTTLDQLSEVVAYIKANRDLISSITTDKVSVADIIDNLTTNVANKPLSAAQGVALKALIDAISVPDKLPNPNALTFTGAVEATYDGSAPLEVEIPSGGGASGDYIPIPASAEVGQTIVVKAVDENGKPTAWEAADMPSGGGSGGGIHLIARVITEANAASIEVTGLSTNAEVLSLRIYNPGSNCGVGLAITVNGVRKTGYLGSITGTSTDSSPVRAWLYRDGDTLYGKSRMANDGTNIYKWPEMEEITSIAIDSPYNDGTTKYFQAGTIFEIYEGMYPNVG